MRSSAKLSQVKDAQSVRCHAQLFPPIMPHSLSRALSAALPLSATHLQSRLSFLLVKRAQNSPCNLSARLIRRQRRDEMKRNGNEVHIEVGKQTFIIDLYGQRLWEQQKQCVVAAAAEAGTTSGLHYLISCSR